MNSSTIGAERELRLVYKPVVYRVQRQLKAVGDAKLIKNIVQMIFYGLLGNEKFFADFLVAKALCDELDRLRLGPISIKERARTVGGVLTVESNPGHGARLTIEVPLG